MDDLGFGTNPLLSDDPTVWDRLIETIGPASMLVIIDARMSALLRRRFTPEDIWQETLLHAWRDRARCEWRGIASFRGWLLAVIENRLRNLADAEMTRKRGGGKEPVALVSLHAPGSSTSEVCGDHFAGPVASTTPSRVAAYREEARIMLRALQRVGEAERDVLRLRLFEELPMQVIARLLDLGLSAVKHRFRKGFEIYHRHLKEALDSGSSTR